MKGSIIILALLMLITACAPAQETQQAPAQVIEKQETLPAAVTETQAQEITEPEQASELAELLARADQRLKSCKYLELVIPDKKQPDTIFVKGARIKIKLYEYDPYLPDNYFDTVYIDTSARTITGRCESRKRCIWQKGDNTKKAWNDINYEKYLPKTPYQWAKEVPATAQILGPEVHENRETTKISYTDNAGRETTMWIDDSYGVPLQVVVKPGTGNGITYKFNDVLFNILTDRDVMPQA